MSDTHGAGSPPVALRAPSGEPGRNDRGRFSSRRKTEAVLRLLRGEALDAVSRELGVTAATLSGWREAFLAGGLWVPGITILTFFASTHDRSQ